MAKITCEGCHGVIAEDTDEAEAEELAFEAEARHEREADIWVCAPCTEAAMQSYYAEFAILDAEANLRAMQDDAHENGAMAAYLRAKGEL